MKSVCFYHGNCFDGICAAWVVSRAVPGVELVPAFYGTSFFDYLKPYLCNWANPYDGMIEETTIYVVDFSFPREQMEVVASIANLRVLDHHKTAQANCEGLDFCSFDMNESGASMAWKYFFQVPYLPKLVRYIKDRDIWQFKEEDSEAVNAYIQSFPMDVQTYEILYLELEQPEGLILAKVAGKSIERYKNQLVQQIIKNRQILNIGNYNVPVVNCPVLMSEVGHALAELKEGPFGAYYFTRKDGSTQWGARSIGDFDVSEVASRYGGGGHKNAAGWQTQ